MNWAKHHPVDFSSFAPGLPISRCKNDQMPNELVVRTHSDFTDDLGAMSAALRLLVDGPQLVFVSAASMRAHRSS